MALADEIITAMTTGSEIGLRQAGLLVLEQAKHNIGVGDPAEDADPNVALAESGHIRPDGDGIVIVFDTPYAAKQHEDQHLRHPRGGGPKYLERALTDVIPHLQNIVGSAVHSRLASGLSSSDPTRPHRR